MLLASPQLRRRLPNAITVARLLVSGVFFAMLRLYQHGGPGMAWWLFAAGWVYGLAAITDAIDGHLARKWNVTSVFGRVVDPFVDKILVLGSFVLFAGGNFLVPRGGGGGELHSLTGVGPIVVILLLSRELLVTTIRGLIESGGGDFGAKWSGKAKMIFQSAAIPVVLFYVFLLGFFPPGHWLTTAFRVLRDVAVWGTVAVTLLSALDYIPRRRRRAGTTAAAGNE